jgi:hypothetical protein
MDEVDGEAIGLVAGEGHKQGIVSRGGRDGIKTIGIAEDASPGCLHQIHRSPYEGFTGFFITDGAADRVVALAHRHYRKKTGHPDEGDGSDLFDPASSCAPRLI